jgi:AcrR family transcriptional regulator
MRKDTLLTRTRLLDAAEKLFAKKGIDNVTLIDVGRGAQQKNRGALQYHFGNKEGLIHAVLDRHTETISAQRQQMLEGLSTDYTPQELIEILVLPIVNKLKESQSGEAFIFINAQLAVSKHFAEIRQSRLNRIPEAQALNHKLLNLLQGDSQASITMKLLLIDTIIFCGLASYLSLKPGVSLGDAAQSLRDSVCNVLGVTG